MGVADWIQSIGLFVAIIGLIITILNNRKQLQIFNDQLKLNFFADYTKRYQEIILNFPENINEPNFEYDELSTDLKNKTLRYMRTYFDLCSEEYDLWRSGYIEDRVWENWKQGIEFAFSKRAFIDAWKIIKLDTIYYPEFSEWVNEVVIKNEVKLQQDKLELEKLKEKASTQQRL
jgi:hypothetical protein